MSDSGGSDFEEFFKQHYAPIVASLRLAVMNAGEAAEDSAQVAFEKAAMRWGRVAAMDRPATWVYVVAVRDLRRRMRLDSRATIDRERGAGASVPDCAPEVVARAYLEQLLAELPPRQRLAVVLRFHADLPLKHVARAMGCSVGTAKSTLHTALARMRVDFEKGDLE